jgi:hypothetical protein
MMRDSNRMSDSREDRTVLDDVISWKELRVPGLTPGFRELRLRVDGLARKHAVVSYKRSSHWVWVLFIGGTGTGKSTIFNAFSGRKLSATGVERPKTCGPILFGHRETVLGSRFPFPDLLVTRVDGSERAGSLYAGSPGELIYIEHDDPHLRRVILVDTPDVDSVEIRNRQSVSDFYLLADLVVFVTSLEKYADDVPFQFLERIRSDGKPFFLLVNKAQSRVSAREISSSLSSQGFPLPPDRLWIFPFVPLNPEESLIRDETFVQFCGAFAHELGEPNQTVLLNRERARFVREFKNDVQTVLDSLALEEQAGRQWIEHVDVFYEAACKKALDAQEGHVSEEQRVHIQKEIRKHFSKYDLLRKPRRLLAKVLLAPLRGLGLVQESEVESHAETLKKMRERVDILPVQSAIEGFCREVLEKLSPKEEASALYRELHRRDLPLTSDEIRKAVWSAQEELLEWLERTFEELAGGIPKSKEMGIYSTSILWGGLILSLEVAIGGGITLLEAVLDSAIAPFVTRGAVELFAYHELQKVGRQLAQKYREGVRGAIRLQRDRYAACLESLTPSGESRERLRALVRELDR